MPPFVPLTNGAQVEILQNLGGKNIENRLWFVDRAPPITSDHLQALSDGVALWWVTLVLPHLSADLIAVSVIVTDWTSEPAPSFATTPISQPGGNPEHSHSANVAVRVRFKGFGTAPRIFNANFVPGVPLDAVETNAYTPDFKTAIFNAYVSLIDIANSFGGFPGWRWVCTSRQVNNGWRSVQLAQRTDLIQFPSPWVSPRRRRLPRPSD